MNKVLKMVSTTSGTSGFVQRIHKKEKAIQKPFYSPLQEDDEVRLLHLNPGSGAEPIECRLVHATLSDKPHYEALSYTWGQYAAVNTITINGTDFEVRGNLWLALQYLRLRKESRILWIDALCINQEEVLERNHQVAQMGRIYNRATRVVVWLGLPDAASKLFFSLSSRKWSTYQKSPSDPAIVAEKNKELAAIYSVFSRPYWTRLWIIQEIFMAREFVIQCGHDTCSTSWLCWFVGQLMATTIPTEPGKPSITVLQEKADLLYALDKSKPVQLLRKRLSQVDFSNVQASDRVTGHTLFQLFSEYEDAQCVDERDNIFGLHSLAPSCCKTSNAIDYSLTWEEVFERLVRHQVYHHDCLPQRLKLEWREMEMLPLKAVASMQEFYLQASLYLDSSHSDEELPNLNVLLPFSKSFSSWPYKGPSQRIGTIQALRIPSYIRGRVIYTSPPLEQTLSRSTLSLPCLTPRLHLQMDYICSLGKRFQHHPNYPYVTDRLDITGRIDFDEDLVEVDFADSSTVIESIPYWGHDFPTAFRGRSNMELAFHQLLTMALACSDSQQILDFEENGLVFFASKDTQVDDLVCQFPGSDILAIARRLKHAYPFADGYWSETTLSRAVNFLRSPYNEAVDICGTQMKFKSADPFRMMVSLWPDALRRLCQMS